jgi:hypothetical protein
MISTPPKIEPVVSWMNMHEVFSSVPTKSRLKEAFVENNIHIGCRFSVSEASSASGIRILGWSTDKPVKLSAADSELLREMEKYGTNTAIELGILIPNPSKMKDCIQSIEKSKKCYSSIADRHCRVFFHSQAHSYSPSAPGSSYDLQIGFRETFKHLLSSSSAAKFLSKGFSVDFESKTCVSDWNSTKEKVSNSGFGLLLKALVKQGSLAKSIKSSLELKPTRLLYAWETLGIEDNELLTTMQNGLLSQLVTSMQQTGTLMEGSLLSLLITQRSNSLKIISKMPGTYQLTVYSGSSLHYLLAEAQRLTKQQPPLVKPTQSQSNNIEAERKPFSRRDELLRKKEARITLGPRKINVPFPIPEFPGPKPVTLTQTSPVKIQTTQDLSPAPNQAKIALKSDTPIPSPQKPANLPPPPPAPVFKPKTTSSEPAIVVSVTASLPNAQSIVSEVASIQVSAPLPSFIPLPPPLKQVLLPMASPENIPTAPELKSLLSKGLLSVLQKVKKETRPAIVPIEIKNKFIDSFSNLEILIMKKSTELFDEESNFLHPVPDPQVDDQRTVLSTALPTPPEHIELVFEFTKMEVVRITPPIEEQILTLPDSTAPKDDSYCLDSTSKPEVNPAPVVNQDSDSYRFDESKQEKSEVKPKPEPEPQTVNRSDSYKFDESEEKQPTAALDDSYEFD